MVSIMEIWLVWWGNEEWADTRTEKLASGGTRHFDGPAPTINNPEPSLLCLWYPEREARWSEGRSLKALQSPGRRKLQLLIFVYTQSIILTHAHLDQRKAFVMPLSLTQMKALPVPLGLRHQSLSKVHVYSGRHPVLIHTLKVFSAPYRRQIILEGRRNSNMLNN